jgi:hypothetical protein
MGINPATTRRDAVIRLQPYRFKPSKPVGIANILIACAIFTFGIVQTVRGEIADRGFMLVWIGVFLIIIAQFIWVTFSKKGTAGILMPTRDQER